MFLEPPLHDVPDRREHVGRNRGRHAAADHEAEEAPGGSGRDAGLDRRHERREHRARIDGLLWQRPAESGGELGHVRPGADTVGPFPVLLPGFFTFDVTVGSHAIKWQTCLGTCGTKAPASAGAFVLTREQPTIKRAGSAWLVTLHFRETQPSGADVLVFRHGTLVANLQFTPGVGESSLGPFVLAPGSYSIKVTATDAYGRVGHLSFSAVLAR